MDLSSYPAFLTVNQAAEFLNLSVRSVRELISDGQILAIRHTTHRSAQLRGRIMVPQSAISRYLASVGYDSDERADSILDACRDLPTAGIHKIIVRLQVLKNTRLQTESNHTTPATT